MAVNLTLSRDKIGKTSIVLGFLPSRGLVWKTSKVPNPDNLTVLDQGKVLDDGTVKHIESSQRVKEVYTSRV